MPRTAIAEQNRTGEGGGFRSKLKLAKGEYARLIMLEQPWSEWVHQLRAPVIENGVVQKEESSRKRGGEGQRTKTEYIGSPFCLGNPDVLAAKGQDEQNCPVCAAAREDPNYKPQRRYAANVVLYNLRSGSWEPQTPLSFSVIVWTFTARMFDQLLDLANEIGPLQEHDIRLECEDGNFQRMKLLFNIEPAWSKYGDVNENKRRIAEAWNGEGNRASDQQLRDLCGSQRSRQQMQEDIDFCVQQWRRAAAAGPGGTLDVTGGAPLGGGAQSASFDAGVASLLEGTSSAPAAQPAASPSPGGLDIFAPSAQASPAAPVAEAPAPAPAAADPLASVPASPVAAPEPAQTPAPAAPAAATPAAPAPAKTFDQLLSEVQG